MKPALLLVDLQNDFLEPPGLQPPAEILIHHAAKLLEACRARRVPVIHIWTTVQRENDQRLPHWKKTGRWSCIRGTAGHAPPPQLAPLPDETIIHKTGFNPFASGGLDRELLARKIDTVVMAGVHLHACVRAAAVESLERQWQVILVEAATGSNDPVHAAATRRWLAERCVRFHSLGEIAAELDSLPKPGLVHFSPRLASERLFEVPVATDAEIRDAVRSAHHAQAHWRDKPFAVRREKLEDFAARLEAAAPELSRQLAFETGKPITHGREEIGRAVANVRDVIRRAANFEFERREDAGRVRHRPHGVVALISPWNNPVAIPVGKIAPALIYGNTVVWKPAPAATRISENMLELLQESGLDDHAVKLVRGDHNTAQRLAADENVHAVTLTSFATAGFAMQEICARRGVPLQAELSGNNAAIVWDDADFCAAATRIAWGAFGFAGQRCTASRRAIVSCDGFEKFLSGVKSAAEQMPCGDPLDPGTEIGPVISRAKRDELTALVAAAETSGAAHRIIRLHEHSSKQEWFKAGAYAQPVVICCDQPERSIVQEESMGPILVVQRAENFDDAIALCNGVRHGLAAALFSESQALRKRFLEEACAGILKINTSTAGADISLPFGGWKTSGVGPPEHGDGDALFFTRMQAVYGAHEL